MFLSCSYVLMVLMSDELFAVQVLGDLKRPEKNSCFRSALDGEIPFTGSRSLRALVDVGVATVLVSRCESGSSFL